MASAVATARLAMTLIRCARNAASAWMSELSPAGSTPCPLTAPGSKRFVMGDFFVIKVMSGGGSASVVGALYEDVGVLQYPTAAASAVVLQFTR